MSNYFFKPELENLSQGARLKFVRELRYMSKPNVAEFLELGGEKPTDSIDKYERNAREPQPERLKELADLFDVSDYAIRRYNFVDPNEVIYQHMWEEELYPRMNIDLGLSESLPKESDIKLKRFFEEWNAMKEKRVDLELSYDDYVEWKLQYDFNKGDEYEEDS